MLTVENDWIEYEALPARRAAVRGGAACAQPRTRPAAPSVVGVQPLRPLRAVPAAVDPRSSSPRAARAAAPLRLTRRGRFVLVVMPALLALCGALLALSGQAPAEASTPAAAPRSIVVGSGDSLWSIAERVAPRADPRDVVGAIERANGLDDDAVLPAGLVLALPASR